METSGAVIEELKRRLRAKNRAFAKLTPARQRVAIARDVLAMLKQEKIEAGSTYFSSEEVSGVVSMESRALDAAVVTEQATCRVCGIGGIFLGAIRNADQMPFGEFRSMIGFGECSTRTRAAMVRYLRSWWSPSELTLIEHYFEGRYPITLVKRDGTRYPNPSPILADPKSRHKPLYGDGYSWSSPKANDRLTMIMENIISNRGRFNPRRGKHSHPDAMIRRDWRRAALG